MELRGRDRVRLLIVCLHLSIVLTFFTQCDGRVPKHQLKASKHLSSTSRGSIIKSSSKLKHLEHLLVMDPLSDSSSNTQPYVSSPLTLPPFESLAPIPLPQGSPPYCESPPVTQQPPSTTYTTPPPPPPQSPYSTSPILPIQSPPPTPAISFQSPPESTTTPYPPIYTPGTPEYVPTPPSYTPGTPEYVPTPPSYIPGTPEYVPGPPSYTPGTPEILPSPIVPNPPETEPSTPPGYEPSPPIYIPSPSGSIPSPTVFLPPVVYPPPSVPPPHRTAPNYALWCVAKPSVPEPIIEEAMNYACGSGADCNSIQPDGSCFQPDTLLSHASYAFNSYWQRTKVAGGTCDFGGTAILVTVDPSFNGCEFIFN